MQLDSFFAKPIAKKWKLVWSLLLLNLFFCRAKRLYHRQLGARCCPCVEQNNNKNNGRLDTCHRNCRHISYGRRRFTTGNVVFLNWRTTLCNWRTVWKRKRRRIDITFVSISEWRRFVIWCFEGEVLVLFSNIHEKINRIEGYQSRTLKDLRNYVNPSFIFTNFQGYRPNTDIKAADIKMGKKLRYLKIQKWLMSPESFLLIIKKKIIYSEHMKKRNIQIWFAFHCSCTYCNCTCSFYTVSVSVSTFERVQEDARGLFRI